MKCKICGHENAAGAIICDACGSILPKKEESADTIELGSEKAEKSEGFDFGAAASKALSFVKKADPKILLGAAGAILVLVLLFSIVGALSKSPAYEVREHTITPLTVGDEIAFFYDGKEVEGRADGMRDVYYSSLDGSVLLIPTKVTESVPAPYDTPTSRKTTTTLYVVTKKGAVEVAENPKAWALSLDGKTVAYVDEYDSLYLYTVKNGKSKEIAQDVSAKGLTLSPNGKKATYLTEDTKTVTPEGDGAVSTEVTVYTMFVYNGKKSVEIGEDIMPLGLDDSAKYVYYIDIEKNALYCTNLKGDSKKISSDVTYSLFNLFTFNKDHTEIVFTSNGKTYISKKGDEKIKIGSTSLLLCAPDNSELHVSLDTVLTFTYGIETFAEKYFASPEGTEAGSDIVYVDKKLEADKKVKNVRGALISDDLETLYYLKNGKLYRLDLSKKDAEPHEVADDVTSFDIMADGSAVYFINDSDELMYAKGKKKAKKIGDDVHSVEITHDGIALFLVDYEDNEGTLYSSKKGGKKKQVANDVSSVDALTNVTYIYSDVSESGAVASAATKGTKFKAIAEDVSGF